MIIQFDDCVIEIDLTRKKKSFFFDKSAYYNVIYTKKKFSYFILFYKYIM